MDRESRRIIDVQEAKGKVHDFKLFKDTIGRRINESILFQVDLGYLGINQLHENSQIPKNPASFTR